MRFRLKRVCSSAWLERTPDKGEVGGSSPPRPTISKHHIELKPAKAIWVLVINKVLLRIGEQILITWYTHSKKKEKSYKHNNY